MTEPKQFIPRPYQDLIIDYILNHKRCMIWAGMGLGKTVSTLTALYYNALCFNSDPILVIAPRRVAASTWPDEVDKWLHLDAMMETSVVVGSEAECIRALKKDALLYCTNYERIPFLVEMYGRKWPFKTIVADECTRLKGLKLHKASGSVNRARELARVAHLYADRYIGLTGTPAPNGYMDLWGQMWFVDHGERLGASLTTYRNSYFNCRQVGNNVHALQYSLMPGAEQTIQKLISDCVLKLNTEDWFDIEQPIESRVTVKLPARAREIYNRMHNELFIELASGAEVESPNVASMMMRCLQIASGSIYTEGGQYEEIHSEKIDALNSIVEEANGASVLVSYQFRHEAERILKSIKGARLLDKDPQTIRDWNAGRIRVLLAHPASCGHGLNLQDGGNILVFYSLGWNLEEYQQIVERIGPTRQMQSGHPRPVYIYKIMAEGTLDDTVNLRLKTKCSVQDALLGRQQDAKEHETPPQNAANTATDNTGRR